MPSCMASSFSQGDAFISSKPERTMTFTSSPPSRRDGAAAVHRGVAAAEHDHALADLLMWPNDTRTASRCRYGCSWPLPCGRECRDRGRAARRSRRRSRPSLRPAAPSGCRCAGRREIRRRDRGCSRTSSSITLSGRRNFGICVRIMPPDAGRCRTPRIRSRSARDRARP